MTKGMSLRSALGLAAALAAFTLTDATISDATARPACVKNREIVFVEKGALTSQQNGGIVDCWVYKGEHGKAYELSKTRRDCWVESYGRCVGPKDEGWIRLRKIRAAK